jgi:hypothetical protein
MAVGPGPTPWASGDPAIPTAIASLPLLATLVEDAAAARFVTVRLRRQPGARRAGRAGPVAALPVD